MTQTVSLWVVLALLTSSGYTDVPVHSDIGLPQPDYAETELGAPRQPPYRINPMLWGIPVGVVVLLGTMVVVRRRQDRSLGG